jgi:hypothetical protein
MVENDRRATCEKLCFASFTALCLHPIPKILFDLCLQQNPTTCTGTGPCAASAECCSLAVPTLVRALSASLETRICRILEEYELGFWQGGNERI